LSAHPCADLLAVWHRLELENKEFFALYQSQLEATVRAGRVAGNALRRAIALVLQLLGRLFAAGFS
jgi:hypothetical protein